MKNGFSSGIVCLIDDDPIYQFTARMIIQMADPDRKVMSFCNGREALDFFTGNDLGAADLPDMIFLDINMPVMNGWEFLNDYRHISTTLCRKIPVYMVSSSVDEEDVARSKSFECVKDFLTKPLDREQIRLLMAAGAVAE